MSFSMTRFCSLEFLYKTFKDIEDFQAHINSQLLQQLYFASFKTKHLEALHDS